MVIFHGKMLVHQRVSIDIVKILDDKPRPSLDQELLWIAHPGRASAGHRPHARVGAGTTNGRHGQFSTDFPSRMGFDQQGKR